MSVRSRRSASALAVAATVTACFVAAAIPATPALGDDTERSHSHRARTVHVTGLLTLTDAKTGEYRATGDLDGKWFIPPAAATDYYNAPTALIQKGTEWFDGCLARPKRCGTLNSDYISWSYLKPNGRFVGGGCVHAPTGGTNGFRGVRGLINIVDTPVGNDINTLYQGEVILNAVPDEGPAPVPAAPSSKAVITTSATAAVAAC